MSATVQVPETAPAPRRSLGQTLAERPLIALTAVFVVLYLVTGVQDPSLFTANGVRSTLLLACPLALFGAAQTLCMLTGGIDLSVAMTANLAAYVAANQSGQGPLVALSLAMTVAIVIGSVNGIGIGVFKVNPLIMTLGMGSVLLGVITVGLVGDGFLSGSTQILKLVRSISSGTIFGPLPANLLILGTVATVLIWGLARTGLGRSIYAIGDNAIACRLAGIRVWQVILAVYIMAAVLAALAGLVFSGISGSVGPDQTNAYLLPGVAAAVIGGTSIFGGFGGYAGTIMGALILTILGRLLISLDTSDALRQVLYGLLVLVLAWVYVRLTGRRTT